MSETIAMTQEMEMVVPEDRATPEPRPAQKGEPDIMEVPIELLFALVSVTPTGAGYVPF